MRGAPILDIGVGGGRTTPLMRAISDDYRGIDYVPAMAAIAKKRFPDGEFCRMDARHLEFPAGIFALVAFSYNGIDSVDPEGRRQILAEVHRVLRPRGCFVFSALNRGDTKSLPRWPDWQEFNGIGLQPARWPRAAARLVLGALNHWRNRRFAHDDGEVAIASLAAHNFALLTVFTALPRQISELRCQGFIVETIVTPAGECIDPDCPDDSAAPWHHFVARKRA
ncbi:MAG TPA: class I SAM-dependent methyltransferase [Acetobacteraceae bacterium]|nr:class I SAM-dependent methyltransferase [Acetobacteraceae bacterium]